MTDLQTRARVERFHKMLGHRCVSCNYMRTTAYRDTCFNPESTQYSVTFDHRGKCDWVCASYQKRERP